MRLLIYGAGVIGSIFAGKLTNAGYDVTLLARGKRYEELCSNGLILRKASSSRKEITHPCIIRTLEPDDIYDYILVVMQKQQVKEILQNLKENRSRNIVFVVNNPLGYSEWAAAVGKDRVMAGFPAAGGERSDGIVNYFIMNGFMKLIQATTFGEYGGQTSERLNKLIAMFNKAGIPSARSANMDAWQKTHVAFVTALGNLLYQYHSDNYEASKHYRDICTAARAIREGFAVIKSLGFPVTPGTMKMYYLPTPLIALNIKLVLKTKFAEVAMSKHTVAARGEMQCLQAEFDTLVKQSGLKTPNIDRLKKYLYS